MLIKNFNRGMEQTVTTTSIHPTTISSVYSVVTADTTQLFLFVLGTLFSKIQIQNSAHYSSRANTKRIFATAIVITAQWHKNWATG